MANNFRFSLGFGAKGDTTVRKASHWYEDSTALRRGLVYSEDFTLGASGPIYYTQTSAATALVTSGAPSFAQGATIMMQTPVGAIWDVFGTTAQTLLPTLTAGTGLEIGLDQVNNEAVEYVPFQNSAYNPFAYTVGTTQPMLFRAAFKFADVSGSDQFLLGWRKQEAFGVPTSFLTTGDGTYTDFFGVGFAATAANPNIVYTAWDVENTGSTTTKSTLFGWADGETHVLEVRLYGAKVKVLINGCPLDGTPIKIDGIGASMTAESTSGQGPAGFNAQDQDADTIKGFNTGDVLIPFIFSRFDATSPGAIHLRAVQLGPLSEFGLDPNNE